MSASAIGPPPNGPPPGGRAALTAFTIRPGGPSSAWTRSSAEWSDDESLASAAMPSAPPAFGDEMVKDRSAQGAGTEHDGHRISVHPRRLSDGMIAACPSTTSP
jgi:hypothetical protein